MQTFIPCESDVETAHVLDWRRLGKQIMECEQILRTLTTPWVRAWENHPAVRMWSGHEPRLLIYTETMMIEWERRFGRRRRDNLPTPSCGSPEDPWWWHGPVHSTHRSALLRKDPDHYSQWGWTDNPTIPYMWPRSLNRSVLADPPRR